MSHSAESNSGSDEEGDDVALSTSQQGYGSRNSTGRQAQPGGAFFNPQLPDSTSGPPATGTGPLKRRRVTRACDECRRKKIKCDGKQPCTHCQVYTYDCTYDQPSNRRRNPDPRHVEALETRLRRARKLLNNFMPDVNLDDPSWDDSTTPPTSTHPSHDATARVESQDSMLESMVKNTGSLDLDDEGFYDFYGHSSGRAFLRRVRDQFGQLVGTTDAMAFAYAMPPPESRSPSQSIGSPSAASSMMPGVSTPSIKELPAQSCARMLCENALDDVGAVLKFVHQPTFYAMFDCVYNQPCGKLGKEELKFIPLLYSVLAVGSLFATAEQSQLMTNGFKDAIEQGSHWYRTARSMTDVTDVRDLTSLQTVLYMVLFLQSSAKLSNCYAHIGICLSSALRMGMHRSIKHTFNPIERETRKRIFWCIVKLDTYVGALLGLPRMISDDDIDQEAPLEVNDDCITTTEVRPMPAGQLSVMAGFNAHTRIVNILGRVVKYVYPIKCNKAAKPHTYIVNHARIREIEHDLQEWDRGLPGPLKHGAGAPREFLRIQHILRMAYAHIEMFLYRPFLHYASQDVSLKNVDKRSYACAVACVSVSRNIIHITGEMKKQGLLVGSYWFYMYTTFFAIISLLFYVLENPTSPTSFEILKDAYEGKDTLARLASKSLAADRCTDYLTDLFSQLSDKLNDVPTDGPSHKRPQKSQASNSAPDLTQQTDKVNSIPHSSNMKPNRRSAWQRSSYPLDPANLGPDQSTYHNAPPTNKTQLLSTLPQNPRSRPWMSTPTSDGVHDLGAMMFPSADPFAYPTQPMITLENRQQFRPAPEQQPFIPSPTGGLDLQYYSPDMPHYNLLSQGQTAEAYLQTQAPPMQLPMPMNMPQLGDPLQPPGQNVPLKNQHGGDYDNLFGEDWSGWMPQGGNSEASCL